MILKLIALMTGISLGAGSKVPPKWAGTCVNISGAACEQPVEAAQCRVLSWGGFLFRKQEGLNTPSHSLDRTGKNSILDKNGSPVRNFCFVTCEQHCSDSIFIKSFFAIIDLDFSVVLSILIPGHWNAAFRPFCSLLFLLGTLGLWHGFSFLF